MEPGEPYLEVQVDTDRSPVLVVARGEVDAASAPQLQAAFEATSPAGGIDLDLAEVTFMDSSGLRVITAARREIHEAGGTLEIVAAGAAVRRIFEMTGLSSLLAD